MLIFYLDSHSFSKLLDVSSLWSSGTAVEVHAEGPVSIPIASNDEDTQVVPTDMQKSVTLPT